MNPVDIVSRGWALYSQHFKRYAVISLRATAWSFVPAIALLAVVIILAVIHQQILTVIQQQDFEALSDPELLGEFPGAYRNLVGWAALAIPAWLVLLFYCVAQSFGEYAAISRLAYNTLRNLEETPQAALRFTRSRKFSFLKVSLLQGLIIFGVYLSALVLMLLIFGLVYLGGLSISTGDSPAVNTGLMVLLSLLLIAVIVGAIFAVVWLIVRIMLTEQPLAIETASGAIAAIKRSWQLTHRHVWRSFLVVLLVYAITLGLTMAIFTASQFIGLFVLGLGFLIPGTLAEVTFTLISVVIQVILTLLPTVLIAPLWRTCLTTLYFDLGNYGQPSQ